MRSRPRRCACVQCLTWFVRRADQTLTAPTHVNRNELRAFAAGITSIEQDFAIQYHARECRVCAEHLADLLDSATGMLQDDVPGGASSWSLVSCSR